MNAKKFMMNQNIKLLNKDRIQSCTCSTMPRSPHASPEPASSEISLQKQVAGIWV